MPKVLPIIKYPHPILVTQAKPVTAITEEIKTLAEDMICTMHDSEGIGLAANQVGSLQQLIVVDIESNELNHCSASMPLVLINPKVVYACEQLEDYNEGCLSFPGLHFDVKRPQHVKVQYTNLNGEQCEVEAYGLHAVCLQHEIDHINGIVFTNHLSSLRRGILLRKYCKEQAIATAKK